MDVRVVKRWDSKLPDPDPHPYRSGAWRPNNVEYDAFDLEVVAGEVPKELEGVYLRNTENPLLPALSERYHPFDGDAMLHAVHFHDGRADYRNRFVRTAGLQAELEAGRALWAGILEAPESSVRDDGWGARGRMKDASSTDVAVLDGFHQECPIPSRREGEPPWMPLMRRLDLNEMKTRLHRWRFDLASGTTREERLDDAFTEFPTNHGGVVGRPHRYVYAMTGEPGWFLFNGIVRYDMRTGTRQSYRFPPGVFASESPMAPRPGANDEADGYVVTFVCDVSQDTSECQIFVASAIDRGPIVRLRLPARISSGTHSCWMPAAALAR